MPFDHGLLSTKTGDGKVLKVGSWVAKQGNEWLINAMDVLREIGG
jgi:hypothetical protein